MKIKTKKEMQIIKKLYDKKVEAHKSANQKKKKNMEKIIKCQLERKRKL